MSNALEYKGYYGTVEFEYEDRMFYGEVVNILDVVSFEGGSVEDLERSFHTAVDAYLKLCAQTGTEPEKPFSGQLPLRMTPTIHMALAILAKRRHKSMNELVNDALVADLRRSEVADILETPSR